MARNKPVRHHGGRLRWAFVLASLAIFIAGSARAETEILAGKHRVIYDIINPIGVERIVSYKNNGYEIRLLEEPDEFSKRVLVEIDLSPLESKTPFPVPPGAVAPELTRNFLGPERNIQVGHPEITALAQKLTRGATTVVEVYDRIANHLRDFITYDAGRDVQQDALSVLRTARGSCVGFTTLSIALLRSSGVPARYAHGYLPPGYEWGITQDYWGVKTSGGGYHAWLELHYPDVGWTFSDGEYSKNFVDPYHILRYTDGAIDPPPREQGTLDVDQGTTFTLVEETNTSHPIDGYAIPEKTILGRRIGAQNMAAVFGRVFDQDGKAIEAGEIVQWEGRRGTVRKFNRAQYALVALPTGKHRFTLRVRGFAEENVELTLKDKELRELDVRLKRGASIVGRITNVPEAAAGDAAALLWQGTSAKVFPLGEGGAFAIEGIEPGGYKLTFRVKGLEHREVVVDAKPGREEKLELTLEPAGWIEGTVRDRAGNAVSGAAIYIKQGRTWPGYPADERGQFVIYGVKAGVHELKAKHRNLGEARVTTSVSGASGARVDFRLE